MWWFFDLIIFSSLVAVAVFVIEIFVRWKNIRCRRRTGSVAVLLIFAWTVLFYGSFIEPKRLVIREADVAIDPASSFCLRAAVVSDMHLGPYKGAEWTKRIVEKVNAQDPDIVFLVGDFVFAQASASEDLEPLKNLVAPYGVWAVTGNHEYQWDAKIAVVDALERFNVQVLENESTYLSQNGKTFILAGISDIWFEGNPYAALENVSSSDTVILLAHNPDAALYANANLVDLIVSGHTHGGQIRLPFLGSVPNIPDRLGRAYDEGIFLFKNTYLFVTSGSGESGTRARLFNPPEIAILSISL